MVGYEVRPKKYLSSCVLGGQFVSVLGKILYPNIFRLYPIGYYFCHTVPYVGYNMYDRIFILFNHGHFGLRVERQ